MRLKTLTGVNAAISEIRDNPARRHASDVSMKKPRIVEDVKKIGKIHYADFSLIAKPAHSLKKLDKIVTSTLNQAKRTWKWSGPKPSRPIVILFKDSQEWNGVSYPTVMNAFVIGLSHRLVSQYDAKSIGRVFAHELCHFFRREQFTEDGKRSARGAMGMAGTTTCSVANSARLIRSFERAVSSASSVFLLVPSSRRSRRGLGT